MDEEGVDRWSGYRALWTIDDAMTEVRADLAEIQADIEEARADAEWTEERWAEYRAEADAYFEALDYGYPGPMTPPAPLPAARVVRRGLRAWLADLCHRTTDRGD